MAILFILFALFGFVLFGFGSGSTSTSDLGSKRISPPKCAQQSGAAETKTHCRGVDP